MQTAKQSQEAKETYRYRVWCVLLAMLITGNALDLVSRCTRLNVDQDAYGMFVIVFQATVEGVLLTLFTLLLSISSRDPDVQLTQSKCTSQKRPSEDDSQDLIHSQPHSEQRDPSS